MKRIIVAAIIFATFTTVAWGSGLLPKDLNGNIIQGGAPNPFLVQILTVNSTTIDVSNNVWWTLYAPTACKYRIMDTTDVTGHPLLTAPALERTSELIHVNTKFVRYTGCTLGELRRQ